MGIGKLVSSILTIPPSGRTSSTAVSHVIKYGYMVNVLKTKVTGLGDYVVSVIHPGLSGLSITNTRPKVLPDQEIAVISKLFNLNDYPIDRPESGQYKSLVTGFKHQLATRAILKIEDFLTADGTRQIAQEIDDLTPHAFHSERRANPYGIKATDDMPADHPYRIVAQTDRCGLAHHQLTDTLLDAVYQWKPLRRFVGDVLGMEKIYLHEDPSNALVVQIYKRDGGLAWHFDRALYSSILNIRTPQAGGTFECVPGVRTNDEPCFDDVRDVLLDKSHRIERHNVKDGSFTIIQGRYTLHRVTRNLGEQPRLSAVLSYEDRPGVKLDAQTRQLFFGPTAPVD